MRRGSATEPVLVSPPHAGLIDLGKVTSATANDNLIAAFETAEGKLEVPQLLDAGEIVGEAGC